MNQTGNFQPFSSPPKAKKLHNDGNATDNLWSSLLDSVASGKRLPEKTLLVLGGSADVQKEFLDTLASDSTKKQHDRHRKKPPIANEFALGYTYQDVLDADQEDTLARLSTYTLSEPLTSFAPLIRPLFTTRTVPATLLVILLDWSEPWFWMRQIRDWIQLLREVFTSLDDGTKDAMEETMNEWQQRRRGGSANDLNGLGAAGNEANIAIPLGPGEWDEALGIPLCVVCFNSNMIEFHETDGGWQEEEFDYILQCLRTILLKHGASLIYSSSSNPNHLPLLIQSSLGIYSMLKRQPLKHNILERDRILVPPNWDSWVKIRVLREGFDVEAVSNGWSNDIKLPRQPANTSKLEGQSEPELQAQDLDSSSTRGPLSAYEDTISNPKKEMALEKLDISNGKLEVETMDMQEFLAGQLEIIENLKAQEEQGSDHRDDKGASSVTEQMTNAQLHHASSHTRRDAGNSDNKSRVDEHIGPVQFNMGGIQADAENMLKQLKDREREETPERELPATATTDGKAQNEALASFFAGLIKRGGNNSPKPPAT
ncbi:hypothetical protein MMC13_002561 [Lambiella insularis]|nr:hypothetical protein [Lambiella insularis]